MPWEKSSVMEERLRFVACFSMEKACARSAGSSGYPGGQATRSSTAIMTMAGLWEAWKNSEDGQWLRSCTIITTEANEMMAPIHDRMRVILGSEDWEKWLGEEPANDHELKAMLKPFPSERMSAWPIGKAVGNVKNDFSNLVERTVEQATFI